MARSIHFRTQAYFNWSIRFAGILFFAGGIILIAERPLPASIMLLISALILTTHYGVEVDLQEKKYRDYLWIAGFRTGPLVSFTSLDYLFLTKTIVSQKMNLRVASSTIRKEQFNGYLRFSENEKVHLFYSDDRKSALEKLNKLGIKLGAKVMDHSGPPEGT